MQPVYPDMLPKQQRMRLAIRIVTFCVVVGVVVLGIVNYMTYHGVRWSLVSLAGIAYLYFTFTFTAQPLADEQQKIIFQGVISAALVLAVDFSLGYCRLVRQYRNSGCRDCDEYYNLRIHDGATPRLAKLYYAAARTDTDRSR